MKTQIRYLKPVSYTHLDVYKRQAYSRLTEPLLIGSTVSSRGGEALIIREIKEFLSQ